MVKQTNRTENQHIEQLELLLSEMQMIIYYIDTTLVKDSLYRLW